MKHTFPTPEPVHLTITLRAGVVRVAAMRTTESTLDVGAPRGADPAEVHVALDGRALTVWGPDSGMGLLRRSSEFTIDIAVPEGSTVRARCGGADVNLSGSLGAVDVACGSGEVNLERADASARLVGGSGEIRVGRADRDLSIRSGSGDVVLDEVRGSAHVKAGSGDVVVHAAYRDVELTTGSGDVRVDAAHSGELRLRTGSGDASIGVPQGVPVWADAQAYGGVRNQLTPRGAPAEGQPHLRIRARVGSGSLHLGDA